MPHAVPSLDTVVCDAVEIPDTAARSAYLDRACGADAALRRQAEELVAAHFRAGGSFLEPSPRADSTAAFVPAPDERTGPDVGTKIGPYTLREQLGEGGMGLVYVAEQVQPVRRKVALKLIKPGMDSRQVVARFEAERQALALMDHPNIARVLDAGTTPEGRPYFVMELVKGEPVTDYCDRHRLDLRRRLELFTQVCQAVQHAHQKGVIHRDLKPSNVLIAVHDVAPVAKVIDFGIAKAVGQSLTDKTVYTGVSQFVGTPLYMSPEQAGQSSLDVDTRTDVYSLGVLLYELLTGTTPIDPETLRTAGLDEVRRIIREDEPPRPSARMSTLKAAARSTVADKRGEDPRRLARQVRGELDWVVMRCLEKDRDRRYESASALAADVQRFLGDEAVQACPPSARYRLKKLARRNKAALVTAAAVALALVAGTAVSAWQAMRANDARRHADERAEDEKAARLEAETQRRRAEANFQKAIEAVDRFLTRVGDESLRDVPQFEPIRQKVLEDALEFTRGFLAEQRDNPALRYQTARAIWRVASMCHQLGRMEESKGYHEEVIALLSGLHAERPADLAVTVDLALVYADVGFLRFDYSAESERHFAHAIELLEPVAAGQPADLTVNGARVRTALANCHRARGSHLARLGRQDEAEKAIDQAIALSQQDSGWWGRDVLASSYDSLAELHNHRRRFPESVKAMERCVAAREAVVKVRPETFYQWELGFGYWCYGNSLSYAGRLPEADDAYRRAADMAEPLAANFPSTPSYSKLLHDARRSRVTTLTKLGKRDEAVSIIGTMRPKTAGEYLARATGFRELGIPEKALTDLTEAVRLDPKLVGAFALRGELNIQTGNDLAAIEDLTRVIELSPAEQRWRAYEKRASARFRLRNYAAARDDFSQAIELLKEPGNFFLYMRRASVHFRLGNYPRALADTDKAVGLKPEDPNTVTWIGPADIAACPDAAFRQGMLDQATRAIRLTGGQPEAHAARAALYAAMGEEAKAREDWAAAVAGYKRRLSEPGKNPDPGRPDALKKLSGVQALLGHSFLRERRYAEAEEALRECLAGRDEVLPDSWLRFNTLSLLGGSLSGRKKYAEAELLLLRGYEGMKQREATIPPGVPRLREAVERLVELYEATNRPEMAAEWRKKLPLPVAPPPRVKRSP